MSANIERPKKRGLFRRKSEAEVQVQPNTVNEVRQRNLCRRDPITGLRLSDNDNAASVGVQNVAIQTPVEVETKIEEQVVEAVASVEVTTPTGLLDNVVPETMPEHVALKNEEVENLSINHADAASDEPPMPLDFWFNSKVEAPKWDELQAAVEQVDQVKPESSSKLQIKGDALDLSLQMQQTRDDMTTCLPDDIDKWSKKPLNQHVYANQAVVEKLKQFDVEEDAIKEKPPIKRTPTSIAIDVLNCIKWALIFVLLGFLITTFVIQRNEVIGTSMLPNLQDGDQFMVEKVSKLWGGLRYGDIVTLHTEGLPNGRKDLDIIKRVIGVPGDKIEVRDGDVYRNDKKIEESYLLKSAITMPTNPAFAVVKLEKDQYFVLGDNRGVSQDSRSFGPIPKSKIIGRAILRVWPFSRFGIPD